MEGSNSPDPFTDIFESSFDQESPPISLTASPRTPTHEPTASTQRPAKYTGQYGQFRSIQEIDAKYRGVFTYPYFNIIQSRIIDDALYSDKSIVVCAPTGSGKTVVFEMAIVQLLMDLDDRQYTGDFKIIYMAPVKALCTERLSEWYPKFTPLGHLCIEVTGDTDVDFSQLATYKIIITTPEKWDMLTRQWRKFRSMVDVIKLFLIDEVHILHDESRGPVLEAVVSRMKTIESSMQAEHRIVQAQQKLLNPHAAGPDTNTAGSSAPRIRFVAVSATVSNPEDVATWLGTQDYPAVYYKMGEECRPVKLRLIVEGYPYSEGASVFKFDLMLSYKLWPIITKYYDGKPTLIFCSTRKSVTMTAETLSRELTIQFSPDQRLKLAELSSRIRDKKLQTLVLNGVGCHHAGLLYEERLNIEQAFRLRDLPILVTTTTLAMGVNLPAHLVIIKCTQQYVNGQYQEYSISTVLQMIGRAGRPQYDTEATAVIMTRMQDKSRYYSLVEGSGPLESALHRRLAEHLNSEVALGTVQDIAQGVQWARSTFLHVRAARDPKRYLNLPAVPAPPPHLIAQRIQDLCVTAMNGLASAGLIAMDEACCVSSTAAGRLMSLYCLDFDTMKLIMKISGDESLQQLLWLVCQSHELAGLQLRTDERRTLNALNRNNAAPANAIRYPMKGKISTKQMKFYCIIQTTFGCLHIPDPSLHQEANKLLRTADRICKCMVAYITRDEFIRQYPPFFEAVVNSITLAKCCEAQLWPDSPYVSRQLRGIGAAFSTALASAGKTTFMLIEESHPRDLERIMNKSAPAGNTLRKQVSLLPKYQLSAQQTSFDCVVITLTLLNAAHMADNISQLTAGENHKSYVVAGDSENCVLLCASFKDINLLTSSNCTIVYSVKRRQEFRHCLQVYCISSTFVGLDVNTSITLTGPERLSNVDTSPPTKVSGYAASLQDNDLTTTKAKPKKQTVITDVFKERKRKNNAIENINELTPKIKKDSKSVEKLKLLSKPYGLQTTKAAHTPKSGYLFQNQSGWTTPISAQHSKLVDYHKSVSTETPIEDFDTNELGLLVNDITYMETSANEDSIKNQDFNVDGLLSDIEKEINGIQNCGKTAKTLLNPIYNQSNVGNQKTQTDGESKVMYSKQKKQEQLSKDTRLLKKDNKFSYNNYRDIVYNNTSSDEGETANQDGFTIKVAPKLENYLKNVNSKIDVHNENVEHFAGELWPNSYESDECHNDSKSSVPEDIEGAKDVNFTRSSDLGNNERHLKDMALSSNFTLASHEAKSEIPSKEQGNRSKTKTSLTVQDQHKDTKSLIIDRLNTDTTYFADVDNFKQKTKNHELITVMNTSEQKKYNSEQTDILGEIYPPQNFITKSHTSELHQIVHKNDNAFSFVKENDIQHIPNKLHSYLTSIRPPWHSPAIKSTESMNNITGFLKEKLEGNSRITLKKSAVNSQSIEGVNQWLDTSIKQKIVCPKNDEAKLFKYKNTHSKLNLLPVMSLKSSVTRENSNSGPSNEVPLLQNSEPQKRIEITDFLKLELQVRTTITETGIGVKKTGYMNLERSSKIILKPTQDPNNSEFSSAFEDLPKSNNLNTTVHIARNNDTLNKSLNRSELPVEMIQNVDNLICLNDSFKQIDKEQLIEENYKVGLLAMQTKENCKASIQNNKEDKDNKLFLNNNKKSESSLAPGTEIVLPSIDQNTIPLKPQELPSVPNILQKYRSTMRKPTNTNNIEDVMPNHNAIACTQEKKVVKKLFKMQDINDIKVEIPSMIMIKNEETEHRADDTLTFLSNYNEKTTCGELRLSKCEHNDDRMDESPADSQEIFFSSQKTNDIDNSQETKVDLDQSMFNPKCLLASCDSDIRNLVIPPPPEFCNNYDNCYPFDQSTHLLNSVSHTSQESVETWNLNTEENCVCNDSSTSEQFSTPQQQLHMFKFTKKEKLKPQRHNTSTTYRQWQMKR